MVLCPRQSARHDCRQLPWETRRRLQRRLQEDTAPPPSDEEGWVGGTGWTGGGRRVGWVEAGLTPSVALPVLSAATIQGQSGDCRGRPASQDHSVICWQLVFGRQPLSPSLQEYLIMVSAVHFLATRIAPAFTAGIQQAERGCEEHAGN